MNTIMSVLWAPDAEGFWGLCVSREVPLHGLRPGKPTMRLFCRSPSSEHWQAWESRVSRGKVSAHSLHSGGLTITLSFV